jgi:hypothetical protein
VFLENRAYLHLETPKFPKAIFQNLTKFSHGGNVLDAPASNTDGFRWRDACVSSTQMNRLIWLSTFKTHIEGSIPFKK